MKAERARGVPMLFCHAGDTFSPSLMSGFDQGAHIIELTNMIKPDVFVPGNHEFDFGKDDLSEAHGGGELSLLRRQHAPSGRLAHPGHEGLRRSSRSAPIKVGVLGLASDRRPAACPSRATSSSAPRWRRSAPRPSALRRQGADIIVAVAHTDRAMD